MPDTSRILVCQPFSVGGAAYASDDVIDLPHALANAAVSAGRAAFAPALPLGRAAPDAAPALPADPDNAE